MAKRTIWKKLTVNNGTSRTWKIEGALYPYELQAQWSRSMPGSNLTLDLGFGGVLGKVVCGGYNKDLKDQTIDLSNGSIVFNKEEGSFITLTSPNKASVLLSLTCEFPEDDRLVLESISEAKGSDRPVVLAEEWQPIPVALVDAAHLAEA